jgi:lipopolysaccharide transport system ATP-binding protein
MKPAISVRNLSKRYRLAHQRGGGYRTLRDELTNAARRFFRGDWRREKTEDFWALREVDFDIAPGEIVGVIGRNGAGKSTLLKILARITPPSAGEVWLRGRVGSLLEVGTGFHPELSGRENIFLSGAILGMKRREVQARFDEIVAFAEVERFLDTPVKRFSSGMYVRLAFAVAAHLETEILLVDEVLAVGDVGFQRKCLDRMRQVGRSGRTVLFVSHNTPALAALCEKGLVLQQGRARPMTSITAAIDQYLGEKEAAGTEWKGAAGDEHLTLTRT